MVTRWRFASTNYSALLLRLRRRRLMRLAVYWFVGGVAGGLMYLVLGIYASIFL